MTLWLVKSGTEKPGVPETGAMLMAESSHYSACENVLGQDKARAVYI
jgi:hypothetical protein